MDTWTCPRCGEAIEETFDSCWKCGTARDGTPPQDPALYDPATQAAAANAIESEEDAWQASRQYDPFGGIFTYQPDTVVIGPAPCPICAATEFAWGRIADHDRPVHYKEADGSIFNNVGPVRVRRCVQCGNLQMFV